MPCPDCIKNHERTLRAVAAERELLLFVETVSSLSLRLSNIERETKRPLNEQDPPPPGWEPILKSRFVLVPTKEIADLSPLLEETGHN